MARNPMLARRSRWRNKNFPNGTCKAEYLTFDTPNAKDPRPKTEDFSDESSTQNQNEIRAENFRRFCIETFRNEFVQDILQAGMKVKNLRRASVDFDFGRIENDIKTKGSTVVTFVDQAKLIRYWYALQRLLTSLATVHDQQITLGIKCDNPNGSYSIVACKVTLDTQHIKLHTSLLTPNCKQQYGALVKHTVICREKPMKQLVKLRQLQPWELQNYLHRMGHKQHNLIRKRKRSKLKLAVNNLLHTPIESSPLQYIPMKFYCWDNYYQKFLFVRRKAMLDCGATSNIISLDFAKYTLPSFLENEKRNVTMKTAKTGDELYVIGITKQKSLILAYNQRTKTNCYKAIYLKYLVVVGVAHDLLLGQPFFQHDSFLCYDGKNCYLLDKSADARESMSKFERYMSKHPILKVKTYQKEASVMRRYIQADYNSKQVGKFVDIEDPTLPNSSEAHTVKDFYPIIPRKSKIDCDDEDMDYDFNPKANALEYKNSNTVLCYPMYSTRWTFQDLFFYFMCRFRTYKQHYFTFINIDHCVFEPIIDTIGRSISRTVRPEKQKLDETSIGYLKHQTMSYLIKYRPIMILVRLQKRGLLLGPSDGIPPSIPDRIFRIFERVKMSKRDKRIRKDNHRLGITGPQSV